MRQVEILREENGKREIIRDVVADEEVMDLYIGDRFVVTLSCSPLNEKELIVGYLFLNGYINSAGDVNLLEKRFIDGRIVCRTLVSSLPKELIFEGKIAPLYNISPLDLMRKTLSMGMLFKETGCTHISGLSDGKAILFCFEDVSRMATIYKLVGYALMRGMLDRANVLITSGRINGSIVWYARRAGIKLIISRAAVTGLAIRNADEFGIALIGFARGRSFNVYSSHNLVGIVGEIEAE